MTFDSIDFRRVRERTEERLRPLLRLKRLRNWLLLEIGVYIALFFVLFGRSKPIFYTIRPAGYTDAWGNVYSFPSEQVNDLYSFAQSAMLVLFILLMVQVVILWLSFRHESFIQREMSHDLELERLHLLANLADHFEEQATEKPKRASRLTDDGELLSEDPEQERSYQRTKPRAL